MIEFLAAFLLSALVSGEVQAAEFPPCGADSIRSQCQKKWTVLVHMTVEPDLLLHAAQDLLEMGAAGKSDRLDVLVHQQTRIVPEELRTFLSQGIQTHPSEHFFVILWGHGKGWKGMGVSIPQLHQVLRSVPIDVLASDACLMQNAEVISELSSAARFVTGTSEVQAYWGFPYESLLREIASGGFAGERGLTQSDDEPYLLARMLPNLMKEQPETLERLSYSSISVPEWDALVLPTLRELGEALQEWLQEDPLAALDIQLAIHPIEPTQGNQRELSTVLRALQGMLRGREPTPARRDVAHSLGEALHALDRATIAYSLGAEFGRRELRTAGMRSVSVWMPASPEEYEAELPEYSDSRFVRQTGWAEWLGLVFSP